MQKITSADQRKLSSFVKEFYCLDSVQLILERVAQGLPMLIGADSVFVATADPKRNRVALLAENVGPELHKLWPTLVALRNENPAISHHMSHPNGPALMIEDILPMAEWKRTAVYNEFYSKLGMRERLSLSLSFSRPDITAIVAHRCQGTFTERDRSVLNLLRFHVSQTCAKAKVRAPPTFPSIMEALESLVGGSIIALDAVGRVQFCSNLAQQYLESFFAKERPFHDGIPLTVKAWALQELARFKTDEFAIRPPEPLVARMVERTLRIRIAHTREGDGCVLLLRADDPALELAKLSHFGLGARSTEVLYWLAKGKTNKEIAIILGMATETVKTHLKDIYFRLDLENRATAVSVISEVLAGV
jgi:DNA-binding CsgD family transcriptional regulator